MIDILKMTDKRPKVLIISPALGKGGMERQLSEFLKAFDRKSLYVKVLFFKQEIEYTLPEDLEYYFLNKKRVIDIPFIFRFIRFLLSEKWDIINSKISGVNEYILLFAGLRLLRPRKIIIEMRNTNLIINNQLHKRINDELYGRASFIIKYFLLKKVRVICNSLKAKQEFSNHIKNEIYMIPNGVDLNLFHKKKEVQKDEVGPFKIGYVGRIHPEKNIETLLLAFKNVVAKANIEVSLEIWGRVQDEEYFKRLKELIKQNKLERGVQFHKQTTKVVDTYSQLDIFVLPSLREGTPNVLLEAMSCEVISIISQGANSDNFLDEEFVFETNNHQELGAKIIKMMNLSLDRKNEIGRRNREFIQKNYSLESMVNSYSELYQHLKH